MQWLADICVRRPVFATVIILALSIVGLVGYFQLGVDRFPKVEFPVITVLIRQNGASPQEIDTEVVDKVEQAVNTISGIDQLTSTSYEGVGIVAIQFLLEKDVNIAAQEVRDKVNGAIPLLPKDIDQPIIDKIDPDAAPILEVALSSPNAGIRDLTEYADKTLRRRLENISGVGQVRILGGRKRQINIWLDPLRMKSVGVTTTDVQRALQSQNIQVPGGRVDQNTRELTLRTSGRVASPEEFGQIVVLKRGDTPIHIVDIGRVEDGMEEAATVANLDGAPTVLLSVRKQSGLNTVATINAVRARIKELEKTLPSGFKLTITRDQGVYINAATHSVQEHLIVGSILAALVVLIFLWNFRTTLISAIAIPTSIVSTFALMYYMNFTLNGLTLLALTLSVGIVIDDAIVVLENIYRFIEEKGMNPFEAAIEGTREIGLAVMATTLSLIAVFLPVAFMSGIVGRFMNSFGLTMAFAIAISLLVSFTLTPMLASRWLKAPKPKTDGSTTPDNMPIGVETGAGGHGGHGSSASKQRGFFRVIDVVYSAMLKWSLRHRWVIVILCLLTLASTIPIGIKINKNFLPDDDESQFQVSIRAPEGTSLSATEALGNRIADDIRALKDQGIEYTVLTIGNNDQQTKNLAGIFVKMTDAEKRRHPTQQEAMQYVRQNIVPKYGNLRVNVSPVPAFSGGGPPSGVSYFISGPDLDKLTEFSEKALAKMRASKTLLDPDSTLVVGNPELVVKPDRKRAAELGVSVLDIANTLRLAVGGDKITDLSQNGELYEVHIRAEKNFRNDTTVIRQITVPSTTQGSIPLEQVVTIAPGTGPSQIQRLNRQRQVTLSANLPPNSSAQAAQEQMNQVIKDLNLPPGYQNGPSGNSREQVKAFGAFLVAFMLSLVFMYLILAAQFESWVHPITILIALPLTVPFALLSILIFNISLNIFSMLGILVLFGVVKKNGILQVDHANQLRAQGMNRYDAIVQACRDRLRPILMTTVAFVVGMVPLVVSSGTGSVSNRNIGWTVIGGQTFSLLLTLLATPVFYSLFDDIGQLWGRTRTGIANLFSRRS